MAERSLSIRGWEKTAKGCPTPYPGLLLKDMADNGVRPDEVDMVVVTHLHRDHVGWNLVWDDDVFRPTFRNARYWIPRADWDTFAPRARTRALSYIRDQVLPLEGLGILELMDGEQPLTSELTALPTPGHTPGHTSVLIASDGEWGVVFGDAAHVPAQAQETHWKPQGRHGPRAVQGHATRPHGPRGARRGSRGLRPLPIARLRPAGEAEGTSLLAGSVATGQPYNSPSIPPIAAPIANRRAGSKIAYGSGYEFRKDGLR